MDVVSQEVTCQWHPALVPLFFILIPEQDMLNQGDFPWVALVGNI